MDDNVVLRALMGAAGASVLAEIDLEKKRHEAEDLRKDRDAARAEIETLRKELADAQRAVSDAFAELDAGAEPTPVAEPTPCPECERLQAQLETANEHRTDLLLFVDKIRKSFRVWDGDDSFFHSVSHALDQLDAGTIKPTPVAEPLNAEGGA